MRRAEGVLLTGVYGSGKSSVAEEIAYLLEQAGAPYALLDLDYLSWAGTGTGDRAAEVGLMLQNLAAVAATRADIADLGKEHGHRVLRVCGKGTKIVLVPLPPRGRLGHRAGGPTLPMSVRKRRLHVSRSREPQWRLPRIAVRIWKVQVRRSGGFRMSLDIREEALTLAALSELAAIPIAFVVDRVLEVRLLDGGLGGMSLTETVVADPYVKDYDAIEGAGPGRFDVSHWVLISARRDGASVGGAVIASKTPGLHMLGGRDDVAVLWDIRVSPRERGGGIGSALFRAVVHWAGARGCRWLKIETQNVNVPACRFYQKMGCTLGAIDRFAYPDQPAEVQLLWWKALASPDTNSS